MKRIPLTIPDKFALLGHEIQVNKLGDLSFREHALGRASTRQGIIELQLRTQAHPINQTEVEQTYLHEVLHLVLDKLGYSDLSGDEKFVDQIAGCLQQVLTQYEVKA